MDILSQVEIIYDTEYTRELNEKVTSRFGSSGLRNATHLSDVLYCLRKGWGKHHISEEEWRTTQPDDDPMLMWAQGLQFEDLVAEGEKQGAMAYCSTCRAVSTPPQVASGEPEVEVCPVCNRRWLVATPDWYARGMIHESKQTRKSQRRGPQDAPWWIEQLVSYMILDQFRRPTEGESEGELVVNWIMGEYGERKKGRRPKPPKSALDAFKVKFLGDPQDWLNELMLRKQVVEGDEMPPLTGMEEDARSPAYPWECPSCQVGKAMGCEMWIWDDDDNEIVPGEDKEEDKPS